MGTKRADNSKQTKITLAPVRFSVLLLGQLFLLSVCFVILPVNTCLLFFLSVCLVILPVHTCLLFSCLCVLSFYLSIHVSFFSCLCDLSFYPSISVSFFPVCVFCHSTCPYMSPFYLSVCLVILSVHTCLLFTLSFSHSVFTFLSHTVV